MKNTLWNAFSDSGELHWIDNPTLVDKISNAYYMINALAGLESQFSDPLFSMSVTRGSKNTFAGENTASKVKLLRPDALEKIKDAISAIDLD